MKNFFLLSFLVLCLCACSVTENNIRTKYDSANYISTYKGLQEAASKKNTNSLLWQMQSGFLNFSYFGPEFSIEDLDIAEKVYKKYEDEGILSGAFSTVAATFTNDRVLPYRGYVYEGSLLNFYKAMAYSSINDYTNARIEFNRANDRQRRAKDYYKKEIKKAHDKAVMNANTKQRNADYAINTSDEALDGIISSKYSNLSNFAIYKDLINPAIPYLSGVFFMLEDDYVKSVDLLKEAYGISRAPLIADDMKLLDSRRLGKDSDKYTWFFIEDGDISRKHGITFAVTLWLGGSVSSINIALPFLGEGKPSFRSYKINGHEANLIVTNSNLFGSEFEKQLPSIITRALISAIAKFTVSYLTSELGSEIGGLLTSLVFNVITAVDTRSSFVLPHAVWAVRIPNVEGDIEMLGGNSVFPRFSFTKKCDSLTKRLEANRTFNALFKDKPKDLSARIKYLEQHKQTSDICLNSDNIVYVRVRGGVARQFIIRGD